VYKTSRQTRDVNTYRAIDWGYLILIA